MLKNHEVNHGQGEEGAGNEDERGTIAELDFRQNILRHFTISRTVKTSLLVMC